MTTYIRIGRVPSGSNPDLFWDVHTDGDQLTCQCPAWTRQTHYADCPAIRGRKCTCKTRELSPAFAKDRRTCPHVREIQPRVDAAGGINRAIDLINAGITLGDIPTTRQTPRASAAAVLAERERYERDRAAENERQLAERERYERDRAGAEERARVERELRRITENDRLARRARESVQARRAAPPTAEIAPAAVEAPPGGRAIRIRDEEE